MSQRTRWGKAGQRLTPSGQPYAARNRNREKYAAVLEDQRTHRQWAAGEVVPYRITVALDMHGLEGPGVDEACGVVEPAVDMWEAGTLYPTWDQLCALAELCGVTPRFFMFPPSGHLPLDTTMRFHVKGADYRQPPPIRFFTPESIAAAKSSEEPS